MSIYIQTIQTLVKRFPEVLPLLSDKAKAIAIKATSMPAINKKYHDAITRALVDFFEGGSVTVPRNKIKVAMSEAFLDAFELGWTEAGEELPLDDSALNWLSDRQSSEFGYIDDMFQDARNLRKQKDFDYFAWATTRANNYTSTVQAIYNAGAMLASKKQMLTWRLGNTEKHCSTCASLNGKRHKASWYISKNYIPREAGAAMACGGYNCDCHLEDDDGNEVTI